MTTCDNALHPDGPWHPGTALPASWQLGRRLQQWMRRMLWGCGCPRLGPDIKRVTMTVAFHELTQDQAAAIYRLVHEMEHCGRHRLARRLVFVADGAAADAGAFRPQVQVAISDHAEAIALWADAAAKFAPDDGIEFDPDDVAWRMFDVSRRRAREVGG